MRIVLDHMNDPSALPRGSQGAFEGYDGVGDLLVDWDDGSSLKLIPGVDRWHTVESDEEINTSIAWLRELQTKVGRDSDFECPRCGVTSVFRTRAVSRIADVSVCSGCGTVESIIAARAGGLEIRVSGADEETERSFQRISI